MKLIEILFKYRLITIIPMEKTTFASVTLPKNVKLTKELVHINYGKLSSIKDPQILYYIERNRVYLWFYPKELQPTAPFVIPESYLMFQALKAFDDTIVVFQTEPTKIFALKEGRYQAAALMKQNETLFIDLLKNEHTISKLKYFDASEYQKYYHTARHTLSFKDLYRFLQWETSPRQIAASMVEKLTYPLLFMIAAFIIITSIQASLMQQKIHKLEETYGALKQSNHPLKNAIRHHNKEVAILNDLVDNELIYIDPIKVLTGIYNVFHPEDNATIRQFKLNGDRLSLQIKCGDDPVIYLNRLNQTGLFDNVIIQNSFVQKNGMKILTYDIQIKKLTDEH